jgi:asparagine synthase (glutamine-hydrolysing)
MFSFVLYDTKKKRFLAARDHVGITTLYQGWRESDNSVWFASEMKSLNEHCDKIIAFPPGHYYSSDKKTTVQYYHPSWFDHPKLNYPSLKDETKTMSQSEEEAMYTAIRTTLEKSVKKRLMTEVPYGVLLSGGLDSSLIASIACRIRRQTDDDDDVKCILLHIF